MKKILQFIVLLLAVNSLKAQFINETFELGMDCFRKGSYNAAKLALERVIFFGEGEYAEETYEILGRIYQMEGDFSRSRHCYRMAATSTNNPDVFVRNKLSESAAQILLDQPLLAKIELLSINPGANDSLVRLKDFLLGLANFLSHDTAESRLAFREAFNGQINLQARVDSLFNVLGSIKHPNARSARIMSIFLPGLGQFYAGDIKNGLNSLLLTSFLATFGLYIAINYTLFDAAVSVVPWFQRYYVGGFTRAENIAAQRLREKQNRIYLHLLAMMRNVKEPANRL